MNTVIKTYILLIIILNIISCGGNDLKISHMIVKNDRLGIILDTEKQAELKILSKIFSEKIKTPNAGPEFRYLIDITTSEGTERWQYSLEGYIRNYDQSNSIIYKLNDVTLFNRTVNIL